MVENNKICRNKSTIDNLASFPESYQGLDTGDIVELFSTPPGSNGGYVCMTDDAVRNYLKLLASGSKGQDMDPEFKKSLLDTNRSDAIGKFKQKVEMKFLGMPGYLGQKSRYENSTNVKKASYAAFPGAIVAMATYAGFLGGGPLGAVAFGGFAELILNGPVTGTIANIAFSRHNTKVLTEAGYPDYASAPYLPTSKSPGYDVSDCEKSDYCTHIPRENYSTVFEEGDFNQASKSGTLPRTPIK